VNVVDHQHIDVAIAIAKLIHIAAADGVNELIDKTVAGEIQNPRVGLAIQDLLANCLEQVGLAQTHIAMNEERVVSLARLLGHGNAGRVRKAIARPDYKIFKGIVGVEGDWLVGVVEDSADAGVEVEDDAGEAAGDGLGGVGEDLLALVLAEVELGGGGDLDVDGAVGHEAWGHLVEPGSMQGGVLGSNLLEHVAPECGIEGGWFILPPLSGFAKLSCRHVSNPFKII